MKKNMKKLAAFVLTLCLCMAWVSVGAAAATIPDPVAVDVTVTTAAVGRSDGKYDVTYKANLTLTESYAEIVAMNVNNAYTSLEGLRFVCTIEDGFTKQMANPTESDFTLNGTGAANFDVASVTKEGDAIQVVCKLNETVVAEWKAGVLDWEAGTIVETVKTALNGKTLVMESVPQVVTADQLNAAKVGGKVTTTGDVKIDHDVRGAIPAFGNEEYIVVAEINVDMAITEYDAGGSEGGSEGGSTGGGIGGGSDVTIIVKKDSTGSNTKTTIYTDGDVKVSAAVSEKALENAAKTGEAVALPMDPVTVPDKGDDTTVTVTVNTGSDEEVAVEIPLENVSAGCVAVIVNPDGTETVISNCAVSENGLLVKVPDGAVIKIVENSVAFDDMNEEHWAKEAVDFVSAREIMNGTGDDDFDPAMTTTRAMIWTMLARLSGVDTTPGEGEDWWTVGQKWAMENGISDGTNHAGNITREQLATMLYRFVGSPDHDHEIGHFHDHHETSDWAREGKEWAVGNGVINGKGGDNGVLSLDPKGEASRAEVAQMFMNFIGNVVF